MRPFSASGPAEAELLFATWNRYARLPDHILHVWIGSCFQGSDLLGQLPLAGKCVPSGQDIVAASPTAARPLMAGMRPSSALWLGFKRYKEPALYLNPS